MISQRRLFFTLSTYKGDKLNSIIITDIFHLEKYFLIFETLMPLLCWKLDVEWQTQSLAA